MADPTLREDWYTTLGVPPQASARVLRRAFLRGCRTHHPDKGGDALAFCRVQAAYQTLHDPHSRRAVDAWLRATHCVSATLFEVYSGDTVALEVRCSSITDDDYPLSTLGVRLPRGARDGAVYQQGHVRYVVRVRPHQYYWRKGHDLCLLLRSPPVSCPRTILRFPHLDGRTLLVRPNGRCVETIYGVGMPISASEGDGENDVEYGNLILRIVEAR